MRILMFGWEFPPHISGGLGTACFGLTKALSKQKMNLLFVVPKAFGDEDQSIARLINASDVQVDLTESEYKEFWQRVEYMQINSTIIPYIGPEEFRNIKEQLELKDEFEINRIFQKKYEFAGGYGPDLMFEVSRYALIAGAIAGTNNFDLIHSHDWLTYPAGIAAKKITGKPLVIHVHATEFDRTGENVNTLVYDIEKRGMEEADMIIAVSELTRNTVIKKYGISPDKVVTVHNGVDQNYEDNTLQIKKNYSEKIVTFLGRITYQKGPEYFVEVAKKILERDENVRFVMAGSGDLMNKIIMLTAKYKLGDKFHFTGFLKGDDVDKMFALSDVYVMPSVSEPFGISPLEAIRSNVPVVISKQSGVAEVLKHAIKVDYWDIDAMANAIYGLLHYDALAKMFRKHAKEEVDEIRWDKAAYKTIEVYKNALMKNKKVV
jgi:glycosyltransferase involved in cell wall biosynthesis